jgi:hypothetical protein
MSGPQAPELAALYDGSGISVTVPGVSVTRARSPVDALVGNLEAKLAADIPLDEREEFGRHFDEVRPCSSTRSGPAPRSLP